MKGFGIFSKFTQKSIESCLFCWKPNENVINMNKIMRTTVKPAIVMQTNNFIHFDF